MGGASAKRPSPGDLKRRRVRARKRNTPAGANRNVFISFTNEDKPQVDLLRRQAQKEDNALSFNDWSLREPFDSERADYIRKGVLERIRQSSVTLVYVSDQTAKSEWVNWEVEESVKLGKRVVGVYGGDRPRKLPPAFKKHGIRVIAWSLKGIAKELK
jgi:Thoeris protein ThsB, TIR-like domain